MERGCANSGITRQAGKPLPRGTVTPAATVASVFVPAGIELLRVQPDEKQAALIADIVAAAEPWMPQTLDDLRELVVGPTLERAWQVWSDGHCPACLGDVRMYEWRAAAMRSRSTTTI